MPKYLSGRTRITSQSKLQSDRYRYLSIESAEPNLGSPLVGPSSIGAKPVPPGQQFVIVSVEGDEPGERYWIPNQGGIIPGSISVFDDGKLVGTLSTITQLNFVGAAITASVSVASSNLARITVFAPGNNKELLFNTANEFSTSTKLTFDTSNGLLTAGDRITVGAGGTVITTTGIGSVGIGTTNPTQELHVQGDLRLTGTIYDYLNQPGTNAQILIKNNFGGLTWVNQGVVRAGAGGTYQNIQFHNSSGLVDGAPNFVFDDINNRIGIGSTQPKALLDVLGISSFKGGTTIDNLNVTGVTTTSTLAVSGTSTTRNLVVTGVTTIGFVTGTNAFFTGIVTASKFVGAIDVSQLYVTGLSTFLQKVNINTDLGVTGLTTTQNLQVYQSTTLNRLNVSGVSTFTSQVNINNLNVTGVGTFDNIKLDTNTVSTNTGNLILDSNAGTTQINDSLFVNDTTESTSKDTGSIITEGGVGIEKNLNVGGSFRVLGITTLAANGGITTTGGDLYVGGNLYLSQDIYQDEIFARNGFFTGIVSTRDLLVTGVSTFSQKVNINSNLGVTGLTTLNTLRVSGISTFDSYIDANGGAYIDNIQIGIAGDNEIDTSTGNLTIDSAGGLVTIDDRLSVTGISTFDGLLDANAGATIDNVRIGIAGDNEIDTSTGNLTIDSAGGLVTIDDNVNISGNLLVTGISTFQGNVIIGDASTDKVSFAATVDSNIIPSGTTRDLGSSANKWNNVYANTFVGTIIGNADTATKLATARNFSITGDVDAPAVSFDGSGVVNLVTTLDNTGVSAGTYGSSTQVGIVTVDAKGRVTAASNVNIGFSTATVAQADKVATVSTSTNASFYPTFVDANNGTAAYENVYTDADIFYNPSTNILSLINLTVSDTTTLNGNVTIGDASTDKVSFAATVDSNIIPSGTTRDLGSVVNKWNNVYANTFVGAITGNADTATKLATARNFSITGDVDAPAVSFDGSGVVNLVTTLDNTGVSAGTYGSSTIVPVFAVDAKGRITSVTNTGINFSTATVAQADKVATVSTSTNALFYPTFVDSNNSPIDYESLYTNNGISYNPSTNLLSIGGSLNLSSTTAATATAILTRGADNNFQLTAQNGVASNTSGQEVSRFGINYAGGGWNTFLQFIRGAGSIDGSLAFYTNNTSRLLLNSSGNLLPQGTSGTLDLGGSSNKWNNVYANTFVGAITGNSDTATKLATSRNIAITGDLSWNVNFDGNDNVTSTGTLANTTVSAGSYGSSTTVPVFAVDAKGRITSVTNTGINFSTATVAQADTIKTLSSATNALFYPTFVDSNNNPAAYESVYTDSGLSYNPSTNSLTAGTFSGSGSGLTNLNASNVTTGTLPTTVFPATLPSSNGSNLTNVNSSTITTGNVSTSGTGQYIALVAGTGENQSINIDTDLYFVPSSNALYCGDIYNYLGGWFRNYGTSGLYNQSYGRGIWAAEASGNPYGNYTTYDGGRNGWAGWGITNDFVFMGRNDTDCGVHNNNFGWAWYHTFGGLNGYRTSTTSATYPHYFSGTIYSTANVVAFSDERGKKEIQTIENALEKVIQLRGVSYKNRFFEDGDDDADKTHIGVIAQEVEKVVPEVVTYAKDIDKYGVDYGHFAGLFIEAFKEQQAQINTLKEEIQNLKNKLGE